jgi:hypothetical protein
MIDVMIYESGNGGEISLKNGDIETTDGLFNQPYLAHFGGNVEALTTGNEIVGVERFDWFGNFFLPKEAQMNSLLEKTLNEVALNSAGRLTVEKVAKIDLDFLTSLGDVTSSASITNTDKITISDKINKTKVDYLWDATKAELIEERII